MIGNGKNENMKSKIYIFFILFLLLYPSQSFKYFKAYTLFSKNFLLITDEGIIKYDTMTKEQTMIKSLDLITSETDLYWRLISFLQ